MMHLVRSVSLVLGLLVVGCPLHNPVPVPIDPPYPAGACDSACARLRQLGCPEGGASTVGSCERTCATAVTLRRLPLECWAGAADVPAAKGCGSLRCVP